MNNVVNSNKCLQLDFSSESRLFRVGVVYALYYALIRSIATILSSHPSGLVASFGSMLDVLSLGLGIASSLFFYYLFFTSGMRYPRRALAFLLGFVLFLLISCINGVCFEYLKNGDAYVLIFRCIPSFLAMLCVTNWRLLFDDISKASPMLLICSAVALAQADLTRIDYMGVSSAFVVPTACAIMASYLKGVKTWDFFAGIAGIMAIVVAGSRGSLFSVVIAALVGGVYCFVINRRKGHSSIILVCFFICACIFTAFQFDAVLVRIQELIPDSRTLSLLIAGEALDGGTAMSRQLASNACLQAVMVNPLLPLGAFADRPIVYKAWAQNYTTFSGSSSLDTYVHNIWVEIMVDFGPILGIFLVLTFLYLAFRAFSKSRNNPLLWVLLSALIVPELCRLHISGSWLTDPMAWVMISVVLIHSQTPGADIEPMDSKRRCGR